MRIDTITAGIKTQLSMGNRGSSSSRFIRTWIWRTRKVTAYIRPLPDFIIVGAQRSGTTSLYEYLDQHPQLHGSRPKEVHFFDERTQPYLDNYGKGSLWYRAHFPMKYKLNENDKTFEASPLYLFHPLVPERMFNLLPQVKLIILLRNPVERAISHYFHCWRYRFEELPILDALLAEERRLNASPTKKRFGNGHYIRHSYKSRGLYRKQIARYLKYFPREQLLIIKSENFFEDPAAVLKLVFEFLGVDPDVKINDLRRRNTSKQRTKVGVEIHEYLDDYFRSPNKSLYELLGIDLGW